MQYIVPMHYGNNMSNSVEEQVFLVKTIWIKGSPNITEKEFKKKVGRRDDPNKTTIRQLARKSEETASLLDEHGTHQQQKPEEMVVAVQRTLLASP